MVGYCNLLGNFIMIFDKLTNLLTAQCNKDFDMSEPLNSVILELRRNPHTSLWAVFFKCGVKGEWQELTAWGTSMMGEPATPRLLRTRFKFIANWRMLTELDRVYRRDHERATANTFLA